MNYDIVIEIDTFEDLKNKGWKIEMNKKEIINMNILSLMTTMEKNC